MKGTVFKYGAQGDPLLRPVDGGKIVVLTGYSERPTIGSTVEYDVTRQSDSVNYGALRQSQPQRTAPERRQASEVFENPLERSLNEVKSLWDRSFAKHMTDKGRAAFPKVLQDIRERYNSGDRQGAAQIAHEAY